MTMRKIYITLIVILLIIFNFSLIESYSSKDSILEDTFRKIFEIYPENENYQSFFAISELRPFSILQFEETVELYDNNWVSAETLVSKLNQSQKNSLTDKVKDYINSFEKDRKLKILSKLVYFNNVKSKLNEISKIYNIGDKNIILSFYEIEATKLVFDNLTFGGEFDVNDLTESQIDELKTGALNIVSEMTPKYQLLYYSDFYKSVASKIN